MSAGLALAAALVTAAVSATATTGAADSTAATTYAEIAATAPIATTAPFVDFSELDLGTLLDTAIASAAVRSSQISQAPAVVEVVTREQIRAWGARTLYDVLRRIPGIEVIENYFGFTNLRIRGLSAGIASAQVLLVVDEQPLYELAWMHAYLEQVPVNAIERIEVIRGPGAVLYGTNAYAGVVHVFARRPEAPEGNLRVAAGLPESYDGRGDAAYTWKHGLLRLSAQGLRTAHWTARAPIDERGLPAAYPRGDTAATLLAQAEQRVGEHTVRAHGGAFWLHKRKWGIFPRGDVDSRPNEQTGGYGDVGWRWQHDDARASADLGYSSYAGAQYLGRLTAFVAGMNNVPSQLVALLANPHHSEIASHTLRAALSGGVVAARYSLVVGVAHAEHTMSRMALLYTAAGQDAPNTFLASSFEQGLTVRDSNVYIDGDVVPVTRLKLALGARFSRFDPESPRPDIPQPQAKLSVNPRAAVVYTFHPRLSGKLLYGRAFRLPSLFDLYISAPWGGGQQGDPDMVPELVDTYEMAFDVRPRDELTLRVGAFWNHTRDEIRWDVSNPQLVRIVNTPGRDVRGGELTLRWIAGAWLDLTVAAAFQEAAINVSGTTSDRYDRSLPRILGTVAATVAPWDDWLALTPAVEYVGARAGLGGGTVWHATAFVKLQEHVSVGLIGRNLFDKGLAVPDLLRGGLPGGVRNEQPRSGELVVEARF